MNLNHLTRHHTDSWKELAEIPARDLDGHWPHEQSGQDIDDYDDEGMPGGYVRLATGLDGLEIQVFSGPDNRATKVILDRTGIERLAAALTGLAADFERMES